MKYHVLELGKRIKHFIKYCFIPIKGRGTVGILQNIIVATIWMIVIGVPISVVCNIGKGDTGDGNFVKEILGNLCLGIVSSSLVVLLTTIIQFKKEREMKWKQYNKIVFKLMSIMIRLSDISSYSYDEEMEIDYNLSYELLDEYFDFGTNLFWYDEKKENAYIKIYLKMASLFAEFHSRNKDISEKRKMINRKYILSCLNNMLVLSKDYYSKRQTIRYPLKYAADLAARFTTFIW